MMTIIYYTFNAYIFVYGQTKKKVVVGCTSARVAWGSIAFVFNCTVDSFH